MGVSRNQLFLFVLTLLGALLLSACGGGASTPLPTAALPVEEAAEAADGPPGEDPGEETTEEMAGAEGSTLTIWVGENHKAALEAAAGDFAQVHGVNVTVEEKGFGNIRDDFTTAAQSGEGPDIIVGAHDWLGQLVSSGLLEPLDLGGKAGEFDPAALAAFTYEGQLYGMPTVTENVAFFYNPNLVAECPATWEEVMEISRALAANNSEEIDTNQYGFVRTQGNAFHFFPIQSAFGGYVFGRSEDGSYNPEDVGIDSQGSIAAAQWWQTMVEEGLQPPDVNEETMRLWFELGRSAMIIAGPWDLARIRESGANYAICNIPDQVEEGRPFLGAQGFMISAFSEEPMQARTFLTELVATAETMTAMYEADPRPLAYLPAREQIGDPDLLAFAEAGQEALPMPAIPEMAFVWTAWENAIVLVAQRGDAPDSAFQDAAAQIRAAIGGG